MSSAQLLGETEIASHDGRRDVCLGPAAGHSSCEDVQFTRNTNECIYTSWYKKTSGDS